MNQFPATICDPATHEPVRALVSYSMRDLGVLDRRMGVVLRSVATEADGTSHELLPELDNDTIVELAARAAAHYQDEMDVARWGNEVV